MLDARRMIPSSRVARDESGDVGGGSRRVFLENQRPTWHYRLMKLLSRQSHALPGVTGVARVSRNSESLLGRVGHGDIVIFDQIDIDRATADALVSAGVTAVVNASPSVSGRYPNLGPEILLAGGVGLVDSVGERIFGRVSDGIQDPPVRRRRVLRRGRDRPGGSSRHRSPSPIC